MVFIATDPPVISETHRRQGFTHGFTDSEPFGTSKALPHYDDLSSTAPATPQFGTAAVDSPRLLLSKCCTSSCASSSAGEAPLAHLQPDVLRGVSSTSSRHQHSVLYGVPSGVSSDSLELLHYASGDLLCRVSGPMTPTQQESSQQAWPAAPPHQHTRLQRSGKFNSHCLATAAGVDQVAPQLLPDQHYHQQQQQLCQRDSRTHMSHRAPSSHSSDSCGVAHITCEIGLVLFGNGGGGGNDKAAAAAEGYESIFPLDDDVAKHLCSTLMAGSSPTPQHGQAAAAATAAPAAATACPAIANVEAAIAGQLSTSGVAEDADSDYVFEWHPRIVLNWFRHADFSVPPAEHPPTVVVPHYAAAADAAAASFAARAVASFSSPSLQLPCCVHATASAPLLRYTGAPPASGVAAQVALPHESGSAEDSVSAAVGHGQAEELTTYPWMFA